jgi:hypothetical protein
MIGGFSPSVLTLNTKQHGNCVSTERDHGTLMAVGAGNTTKRLGMIVSTIRTPRIPQMRNSQYREWLRKGGGYGSSNETAILMSLVFADQGPFRRAPVGSTHNGRRPPETPRSSQAICPTLARNYRKNRHTPSQTTKLAKHEPWSWVCSSRVSGLGFRVLCATPVNGNR